MNKYEAIIELAKTNEQPVILGGGMAHCAISTDGICPTLMVYHNGVPLKVEYEREDSNNSSRDASERN